MSRDSDEIVVLSDSDDATEPCNSKGEEKKGDEEDGVGSIIRIRSLGDDIFENEGEEDDEFLQELHEMEMESTQHNRKRKQEINSRGLDDSQEVIELDDDNDQEYEETLNDNDVGEFYDYNVNQQVLNVRKGHKVPMYLLNPDEFSDDPHKQMQIRRAKITYRHHQYKKQLIIDLTEEGSKLRKLVECLKLKVFELANCGCLKNKHVNLEILEEEVPSVPCRNSRQDPDTFVPPQRQLAPSTPTINTKVTSLPNRIMTRRLASQNLPDPLAPSTDQLESKPLINIGGNLMQQINLGNISGANIANRPSQPFPHRVILPQAGGIKLEIKSEPPAPEKPQTASQMLFNLKRKAPTQPTSNPVMVKVLRSQTTSGIVPNLAKPASSLVSLSNYLPNAASTYIVSNSAQRVNLVQSKSSGIIMKGTPAPATFRQILPKPNANQQVMRTATLAIKKSYTKEEVAEMWRKFEGDDVDEDAIIAAITGNGPKTSTSPTEKPGRKQSIGSEATKNSSSSQVEFNKYADVVFEEAD